MKKRYAVYSRFIWNSERRLVSRHYFRWMAVLWAAQLRNWWTGFWFEVVAEEEGGAA